MKNEDYEKLIYLFLDGIAAAEDLPKLSRTLGHNYNIYKRWLSGTKKFLWRDFVQLAELKNWDLKRKLSKHLSFLVDDIRDEHKLIDSIVELISNDNLFNDVFPKHQRQRIQRGQRSLSFEEFLLISTKLTSLANTFYFLESLCPFHNKENFKELGINFLYEEIIEKDLLTLLIRNILELKLYISLETHSDEFLSKLLNTNQEEIRIRINILKSLKIIKQNKKGLFEVIDNDYQHFVYNRKTSSKVHHLWRKEIYHQSQKETLSEKLTGAHLMYKTSHELDSKVLTLSTRFFNDLRMLIKEQDCQQDQTPPTHLKVMSLNFYDPLE